MPPIIGIDATFAEVLDSMVSRMASEVTDMNESTVWWQIDPYQGSTATGNPVWLIVAPGGGQIDQSVRAGGIRQSDATMRVVVHTNDMVDQGLSDRQRLERNLLRILGEVIKAGDTYMLKDKDGAALLVEPMACLGWQAPSKSSDTAWLEITFNALFDWSLAINE